MKVLQVCAELFPLVKTGGLADVCAALPAALGRHGCEMRVLLPGLPSVLRGVRDAHALKITLPADDAVHLLQANLPDGAVAYVIDSPLFNREGSPYADAQGRPFDDNHRRFALLSRVAALFAEGLDPAWRPQVIHAHDWHAGLMPAYLRAAEARHGQRLAGTVFTVHNLAYQGLFPMATRAELGLPASFFRMQGLEFWGQVSFMKAGLVYADKLTTVSPTYAREIQAPEQGCGLDGVLRERAADLSGILNGVDPQLWSPAVDPHIAAPFNTGSLAGKATRRARLQAEFGVSSQREAPVFAVVSRLTEQKGLHLVLAGLPELLRRQGQLLVLGSGEAPLEAGLREAAAAHPSQVGVRFGFDEALAHRLIAGADVMLVPSRFEPCGLTQLYGLAYGTLPLVHRVGGLADTVADCTLENLADDVATGFTFDGFDGAHYGAALHRADILYRRRSDWLQVQRRAMAQRFDWDTAAAQYASLYAQVAVSAQA